MKNFENFIIFLNQELEKLEQEEIKADTISVDIDGIVINQYIPNSLCKNFWEKVELVKELENAKKLVNIYLNNMEEKTKQILEKGLKSTSKTIEVCNLIDEGIITPYEVFYFLKNNVGND